ncbi:hypothetical protein L1987_22399 [Smallanthus sonchifolius]|uniref:Uncharacterized protein n=1 Tax=Smallanthus sonchifolius TaxID=185202 RepID=A0ACB9IFB9_9ASTR|nr:hypothetical protein L1987_22399 [Smallanthus sonchifolius]
MKGAATGLAAGTIWGTIVATWLDVPRVERNIALPGLIRTLKMMGNHGLTFAAIGGVYIGVEQLTQNYRQKTLLMERLVGSLLVLPFLVSKARAFQQHSLPELHLPPPLPPLMLVGRPRGLIRVRSITLIPPRNELMPPIECPFSADLIKPD